MRSGRILVAASAMLFILAAAASWLHVHITRFDDTISVAAANHGIDFYLIKALIFEESWFRPGIRGPKGEFGIMQITKPAAADFAARHWLPPFYEARLLEPELNIEIGCWYLRQLVDRYKDSPDPILYGLLAYNAGSVRADAWLRQALSKPVPPGVSAERYYLSLVDIPPTREYVHHILERFRSRNFWF